MFKKLAGQSALAFITALVLFLSANSHISALKDGAEIVMGYMAVNYTKEHVKAVVSKGKEFAVSAGAKLSDSVATVAGNPTYGEAIDEDFEGTETSVYAVGGGDVVAVGENEEIGKYIRINHGGKGESLYGNLKSVNVTVPGRVKKGDIIGTYEKKEGRDFYYSFRESD